MQAFQSMLFRLRHVLLVITFGLTTGYTNFATADGELHHEKGQFFEGDIFATPDRLYGGRHGAALAITPDSSTLIASRGNFAVVMNAADFTHMRYLKPDDSDVTALAVSPDGIHVLVGTEEGTLGLYALGTGEEIRLTEPHTQRINAIAFSFDGTRYGTVSDDAYCRIRETSTDRLLNTVRHRDSSQGSFYDITCIDFSPNSYRFITGGEDNYARLWDGTNGLAIAHTNDVTAVAFLPTGSEVLTTSRLTAISRWSATTGTRVGLPIQAGGNVYQMKISPAGDMLLTGLDNGVAKLWNLNSTALLQTYQGHTESILSVAYAPDGNRVYTASADASLRVWGTQSSIELGRSAGHTDDINEVDISRDDSTIVSVDESGTLLLWEAASSLYKTSIDNNQYTFDAKFGKESNDLFVTSNRVTLRWDTNESEVTVVYPSLSQTLAIDTTPSGKYLLSGSSDATLSLWEVPSGAELNRISIDNYYARKVAISDDATLALVATSDYRATLWNPITGEYLAALAPNTVEVTSVELSGDGEIAITGAGDGFARLYRNGLNLPLIGYNTSGGFVTAVALSPDKETLLTGSTDGISRIFDVDSGVELARYTGHSSEVSDVAFSPSSGDWVLSAENNGSVHRWPSVPSCRQRCEDEPQDTDSDGLSDCFEICIGTEPASPDTDDDGMDDYFEYTNYLRRDFPDADLDRDGDGLNNIDEATLGLTAYKPDTDADGMLDGYEVEYQLDPFIDDSTDDPDGDGIENLNEFNYNTSPLNPDTDGDSMSDDYEIAYGLNPTRTDGSLDRDRDGLTNIEEAQLGLNPRTGDTDGDDLPDGYEVANGLNPFERDSLLDSDADGLTNIQELWASTDPQNGDDPPVPTYVNATTGSDTEGTGTIDKPFLSISAALLDMARYTYNVPSSLLVQAGTYTRPVEIPENVTLSGEGANTILYAPRGLIEPFVKISSNASLTDCTVTLDPQQTSGLATLVQINGYNSSIRNVTVTGVNNRTVTGIADNGSWYSQNQIHDCTFSDLSTAIVTVSSNTQIARCRFENISGRGLRALGTFRMEGVPTLGSINLLENTGFNRWHSATGVFIELEGKPTKSIDAAYNDWGAYTDPEIAARILALGTAKAEDVYSAPFLPNPLQPGDHVVVPVGTSNRPLLTYNPLVTVGDTQLPADNEGLVIIPGTLPGSYEVTAAADLHCPNTEEIVISDREIHVTLIPLESGTPNPSNPDLCDPIVVEEGEEEGEGTPEGEEITPDDLADAVLDRWSSLDSDNNGSLSYAEIASGLGIPANLLPRVDQNLDGIITIGELQRLLTAPAPIHSADTNGNRRIDLSELLRILQLHAAGGYDCATQAADSEDGYVLPGLGSAADTCRPHASDYRDGANGVIDLTETLRAIQLYNFGTIASCPGNFEDDFCAVNK